MNNIIKIKKIFQIVLNEERYNYIKAINLRPELFTTNPEEGFIEVIKKGQRKNKMFGCKKKSIYILPTGWQNKNVFISQDKRDYVLIF